MLVFKLLHTYPRGALIIMLPLCEHAVCKALHRVNLQKISEGRGTERLCAVKALPQGWAAVLIVSTSVSNLVR